jgi:hypothetical protein
VFSAKGALDMARLPRLSAYDGNPNDFRRALSFWARAHYALTNARDFERCREDMQKRKRLLELEICNAADASQAVAYHGE